MNKMRWIGIVCALVIFFGLGTGTGIYIESRNAERLTVSKDSLKEFQLVEEAWNLTREKYVDTAATQPQALAYGTITGMVDSLGDTGHSTFLTPQEVVQQNNFIQGQLQGIGVEVQEKNGNVVIVAPIDGSPAQKAGLVSGDVILKVDGQAINNVTDAVRLILGTAGTSVTVTIQSSTGATRDVTIVRAIINLVSLTWHQLPGSNVAHLRISSFSKGVSAELDNALAAIRDQGDSGIILDLRDNPGGLLDEAVSVASRFLSSGNVLEEKDINGKITAVPVAPDGPVNTLPIVVLVNQGSASAAEIVAGALQDSGRAKLVGQTTFGTGTVLVQFPLSDGSAVVLAIQEWLTPSGKTIWHNGLSPDQTVSLATAVIPVLPEQEGSMTAPQVQASGDQQLLSALNLLSNTNVK